MSVAAPGVTFGMWSEELLTAATTGFCETYYGFDMENADCYQRYIEVHKEAFLRRSIDLQLSFVVHYFTKFALIGMADFEKILEYAQRKKAMEAVAILLEYRNTQKTGANLYDKYSLDEGGKDHGRF